MSNVYLPTGALRGVTLTFAINGAFWVAFKWRAPFQSSKCVSVVPLVCAVRSLVCCNVPFVRSFFPFLILAHQFFFFSD